MKRRMFANGPLPTYERRALPIIPAPPPDWFVRLYRDLVADQLMEEHRRCLAQLPLWQQLGHWLLLSWHCPACKRWNALRPREIRRWPSYWRRGRRSISLAPNNKF